MAAALVVCGVPSGAHAGQDPREVQGRTLFAKGEYEAALNLYATLFGEKGDAIYLRNIARCNQKLRRPDQAIDAFREYLRRMPNLRPAERREIEGFIKEMEALRAERQAAAATPKPPPEPEPAPKGPVEANVAAGPPPDRQPLPLREVPAVVPISPTSPTLPTSPTSPGVPAASVGARGAEAGAATEQESGQTGTFFLAFALGTGYGIASGQGELNPAHEAEAKGFAPAQVGHFAPEIGLFFARRLLLSAQLRLQYLPYVTGQHLPTGCGSDMYCEPEVLGLSAFARAAWFFGSGPFRFIGGVAAGGGRIRHDVLFPDTTCGPKGNTQCLDTLSGGPFLFGPTVGFLVELGRTVGLLVSLNTQVGVPRFTLNFDLNGGIAFRI